MADKDAMDMYHKDYEEHSQVNIILLSLKVSLIYQFKNILL